MKKYKTLFFDVDDTLLDFGAAEKLALQLLFEEQNILHTPEIEEEYKRINQGLWRRFEEGEMSRDEVVNTRFSSLLHVYGKEVDGKLLEKKYRSFLEEGHQLVDGAFDLIRELHSQYDLYIVTNGVSRTQDKRLRSSGLFPFFKDIFVSEDTGFQKPMKEFFDYVFERIPQFNVNDALIIGDSLSADIKGGQLAGMDTCWFNPKMKQNDSDSSPNFQIHKLEELKQIVSVKDRIGA
ncbi:YjjG family noncanonical pyrimidine nucleotidase [Neobacillus niacini]|uniref:YjjG family noncanonical pyrimidine nucleotidase n=1 Tax=Neobacillus niacini TaxID=86668 RepID=UPI00052F731D|nr:YjjG family noncanonical pyrimidine nucleotidase [Neobacillus niacini]KGM45623.1 HAD family hydrolase [Neobacillus niacini]MEC1525525.1 YjjG family noncanonical pyrimidine nucleotidase [Neobacillus niacini]